MLGWYKLLGIVDFDVLNVIFVTRWQYSFICNCMSLENGINMGQKIDPVLFSCGCGGEFSSQGNSLSDLGNF